MEFTLKEIHLLKEHYSDVSAYSLFNKLPAPKGEGSLETLEKKQVLEDGQIVPAMKNVLDIIAFPEIVAHFQLKQLEVNMVKNVYGVGKQRILVEFHRDSVIISTYETEIESLRTEIANHVGASFQKHSLLKQTFNAEELLCFAALVDWLRRVTLGKLLNQELTTKLSFNEFVSFIKEPLNNGILSQVLNLTKLPIPNESGCKKGLAGLKKKFLVESYQDDIVIDKSTVLFAINFLVPNTTITLELYDLTNSKKILTAKEKIIQATPKDILSLSANAEGYLAESLTSTEVISKIMAYLSGPSLNNANAN